MALVERVFKVALKHVSPPAIFGPMPASAMRADKKSVGFFPEMTCPMLDAGALNNVRRPSWSCLSRSTTGFLNDEGER